MIQFLHTCLWAYTTEPSSFQVPPRRSMRTILRIWKKRSPRRAEAANTWPLEPILSTTREANMVLTSVWGNQQLFVQQTQKNFLIIKLTVNRSREMIRMDCTIHMVPLQETGKRHPSQYRESNNYIYIIYNVNLASLQRKSKEQDTWYCHIFLWAHTQ